MLNTQAFTQAIEYQKTMFDNSYAIMTSLQEQGNKMVDMAFDNSTILPDGSKKVCSYWMDFFKQNTQNYKTYVDTSFDRVKEYVETATVATAAPAAKTTAKKTK